MHLLFLDPTVQDCRGHIMIWGCFSYSGYNSATLSGHKKRDWQTPWIYWISRFFHLFVSYLMVQAFSKKINARNWQAQTRKSGSGSMMSFSHTDRLHSKDPNSIEEICPGRNFTWQSDSPIINKISWWKMHATQNRNKSNIWRSNFFIFSLEIVMCLIKLSRFTLTKQTMAKKTTCDKNTHYAAVSVSDRTPNKRYTVQRGSYRLCTQKKQMWSEWKSLQESQIIPLVNAGNWWLLQASAKNSLFQSLYETHLSIGLHGKLKFIDRIEKNGYT